MPNPEQAAKDDNELMRCIARDRDFVAFEELCRRHQKAAYNLARYLLRNETDAQDVIQDAFSQIWITSSRFRTGNPRAWILCIVQRSCFRKTSKRRREQELLEMKKTEPSRTPTAPEDQVDSTDLFRVLRGMLNNLSPQEQRIVALRFGADLSQDDIAQSLSMPRSTVSKRIKEILNRLRLGLTDAGFAGATSLLTPSIIGDCICSGHPVPRDLTQRILDAITRNDTPTTAPHNPHRSDHVALWLIGVGLFLTIGVATWRANRNSEKTITPAVPIKKASPTTQLPLRWNFKNGLPTDLKLVGGNWKWQAPEARRKASIVMRGNVWISLPDNLPQRPMCLSLHCMCVKDTKEGYYDAEWLREKSTITSTVYSVGKVFNVNPNSFRIQHYIWGSRIATVVNGKIKTIAEWDKPWPSNKLAFCMKNLAMTSIELREVALTEIPEHARAEDLGKSGFFDATARKLNYEYSDQSGQPPVSHK